MDADAGRGFIGRRRELDTLDAELEWSRSGRPRVVLLSGEPGIGKTRTAQEMAEHAGRSGALALWARCPEEPGAPPYWPWLQLIRRYVAEHDPGTLSDVIGPAAPYLAALDSELATRPSDPRPDVEPNAAKARFRLFDAVCGLWQRAAARQPLLLVIDDLHRADVPSLRLLEFVVAEAGDSRLLVLGTYRDAEVARQHPLSDTLAQLHRHVPVQRLLLGGFSPVETAQFVAAATGSQLDDLAARLHDQTEGHPLFLTELARDIGRSQRVPTRVPKGVREVIGARLNHLTPLCVDILQHAAVFGREFHIDLLIRVLDDVPREACLAALEEATRAGLVNASVDDSHLFAHALVRDTLYDELPTARRAELHQRIGAAFESRYEGDLTPCLSALAHHYHAAGPAGDAGKAIEYASRAAEQATAMLAHEEATGHYRRALTLLQTGPEHDARRCQLLLGMGNAQNSAGSSGAALGTFSDAAACARRLHDPALLARSAIGFGDAQWRLGIEGSTAVALIREALALDTSADSRERAALLTALCQALLFANRPDAAESAFREAVAIARRLDDPLILFRALCSILPGRWFPDRLALRIDAARQAMAVAQGAGHPEWASPYLAGWHTGDLMESGDTVEATQTARLHLVTGATMREPFNEAVALAALTMIATHEGRFADAEPLALRALQCGRRFDGANAAGIFGVQMFTLRRHQGRLGELAPVLRQFLDKESTGSLWRPGLAVLHCELGALDEARKLFEALAIADFGGLAQDAVRVASLAYLAEVCVLLDDKKRAATLFALLRPYSGRNIVFGAHTASFGAADRLLGLLATTLQRWDVAQRHLEAAVRFDERTGGRPWLAQSQTALASHWLRRGQPGDEQRAQPLLAAALEGARTLGMASLQETVSALSAPPDEHGDGGPDIAGLSKREIEVLRLVAAGKTNQEIATALFRSPNTVANHVRNILGKTQAANRAEASAFAVRHGLMPPE